MDLVANQIHINVNPDNTARDRTIIMNVDGYDAHQTPADLDMARNHGRAKRVYVSKDKDGLSEHGRKMCICCNLPVDGKPLSINCELDDLYHLGSGFALYFGFIKYCIALLVVLFLSSGVYNIVTNSNGDDCSLESNDTEKSFCVQGYIISYSIANKKGDPESLKIQLILNLLSVILIMFFFHFIRYRFRKIEIDADDQTITPSDYTIELSGIPPETTDEEIKTRLNSFAPKNKPFKIERIIRTYAISKYIELSKNRIELLKELDPLLRKEPRTKKEENAKIRLETRIQDIIAQQNELKATGIKKCPIAYVTFELAEDADFVVNKFKKVLVRKLLSSSIYSQVSAKRAPEPSDIIWENLAYTPQQIFYKRVFTNLISIILIGISFGLIIFMNWAQGKIKEHDSESKLVSLFSIFCSLIIVATNAGLAFAIVALTKQEKHHTQTYYLKGVTEKLAIAQFFNTALTTLFAQIILQKSTGVNYYGTGGLLDDIFWVFVISAILTPVLSVFDFAYFFKLFRQRILKKENKITQDEAHQLFEGPILDVPFKYAGMIKIMLMTTFYAPALPVCVLFTIGGLFLSYWVDKYNLLRRNSLQNSIDDEVSDSMVEYLEWAAFTFAAGNIMHVFTLKEGDFAFPTDYRYLAYISIGISLFHIICPMELINKKLIRLENKVTEKETFEKVRENFTTDYDMENPLTRRKAMKEFRERLMDDPEKYKLLQKDLFSKLDPQDFNKIFNAKNEPEAKEKENHIDFDELDNYIVKAVKAREVPSANRKDVGSFFKRLPTSQESAQRAAKYILGDSPSPKRSDNQPGQDERGSATKLMGDAGLGFLLGNKPSIAEVGVQSPDSAHRKNSNDKLVDDVGLGFLIGQKSTTNKTVPNKDGDNSNMKNFDLFGARPEAPKDEKTSVLSDKSENIPSEPTVTGRDPRSIDPHLFPQDGNLRFQL